MYDHNCPLTVKWYPPQKLSMKNSDAIHNVNVSEKQVDGGSTVEQQAYSSPSTVSNAAPCWCAHKAEHAKYLGYCHQ